MAPFSSQLRYGSVAQTFHWLTALLVVAAYVMSPGGSEQRVYAASEDFERGVHECLGLLVLLLVLLRLGWRLLDHKPEEPATARWMELGARLVHYGLYGLLVAVPVTAILGAWWEGHALNLLALGDLPPPLAEARTLGETLVEIHRTLGDVILWTAGLHAAAALYHHYILRDRVLASMLPWRF